jgi:hypothetical protein
MNEESTQAHAGHGFQESLTEGKDYLDELSISPLYFTPFAPGKQLDQKRSHTIMAATLRLSCKILAFSKYPRKPIFTGQTITI